jgi:hypothetical protein
MEEKKSKTILIPSWKDVEKATGEEISESTGIQTTEWLSPEEAVEKYGKNQIKTYPPALSHITGGVVIKPRSGSATQGWGILGLNKRTPSDFEVAMGMSMAAQNQDRTLEITRPEGAKSWIMEQEMEEWKNLQNNLLASSASPLPPWMRKDFLLTPKALRKKKLRQAKRKNRYSTAGNLLAKRRSLRKCFKRAYKRIQKVSHVDAVSSVWEQNPWPISFPMYYQRAHIPSSDSIPEIYGSSASNAMQDGRTAVEIAHNLTKNERLPINFGKSPIYIDPSQV